MTAATAVDLNRAALTARVSVVIVNWNTSDLLDQAMQSLRRSGDGSLVLEVIVVDNGSTDASVEMLASRWPSAQQIRNETNRGYQAANNQGMAAATGEYVLLLNTDATLQPGCLSQLVSWLDTHPRAGIVAPRLSFADGAFQRWTAGQLPTLRSASAYFFTLDRLFPKSGLWLGRDLRQPFTPGWVSSACMLLRRSALLEIGPMDERFFAYMDDVDICARAWSAGWQVWYLPEARATHLMGASAEVRTNGTSPAAVRALVRYVSLTLGHRRTRLFQLEACIGFALRALAHACVGRVRGRSPTGGRDQLRNIRSVLEPINKQRRQA
ncbi:MAG: hypothetical protein QOH80_1111 [Actinomycetota bacterium]|jgi:GT2 family glycosyltransferase|nr:hypothetical protein [Actinomycetota bacterium]